MIGANTITAKAIVEAECKSLYQCRSEYTHVLQHLPSLLWNSAIYLCKSQACPKRVSSDQRARLVATSVGQPVAKAFSA